nr:hypothetical protein [uncultured Mediterranean phage uvMED]
MKIVDRHRYKDNKIIETRRITFEPFPYNERYIGLIMGLIERNLSPDLLKGRKSLMYPDDVKTNKWYGHCYHTTQALFYSLDTELLVPMSAEDYRGEKHWWLQNSENGRIYDCTEGQYYFVNQIPPHHSGKKSKWYGWKGRPQQTSLNLLISILGDRLIGDEKV